MASLPLPHLVVVLRCADRYASRARYTLETLLLAAGIPMEYRDEPPTRGHWLLYGSNWEERDPRDGAVAIAHCPQAWDLFDGTNDVDRASEIDGLAVVLPPTCEAFAADAHVRFDLLANAFYFLSSWSERIARRPGETRTLFATSCFARLGLPQDIVDRYLSHLELRLHAACRRLDLPVWSAPDWLGNHSHAVVLSHDVDFIPSGALDVAVQGAKTVMRHLLRQRDPGDALRAAAGLVSAVLRGRDPYGCVPEIIEHEQRLGVRSSFQVAVGHRHPADVNYHVEDDRTRDYLRAIPDAGFDLCLHGSYRSTENPAWYEEEVALLERRLGRPSGSRQHFLSFDYDTLFSVQERCGIAFDMSMGFPDRAGPRAGFSHPYRPFDLARNRPYRVLEISLFLMDVTLRGYLGLKGEDAWRVIDASLADLAAKKGCASVVWHPIVFGGARDPGFDTLYWRLIERVQAAGGVATDGRSVYEAWRERARSYPSLA